MSDRTFTVLASLYVTGWLIDWAYWIQVGWTVNDIMSRVGPVLFGWAAALFWPLHAVVELWRWGLS